MNYFLTVKFGDSNVMPVDVPNLKELTIVQDMNSFLPSFRMRLVDASGQLTHVSPIDKTMGKVSIGFSQKTGDSGQKEDQTNDMEFDVYVFEPEGEQSSPACVYDIQGLLKLDDTLTTDYSRGFSGTINETITTIAKEIGISGNRGESEILLSPSLNYNLNLVQPFWNNLQFLKYLKERVTGPGEWGFKCFTAVSKHVKYFYFKALSEMMTNSPKYKFILSDKRYQDQYPIYRYNLYGNSKIYTTFAGEAQDYIYFDYMNEEVVDQKTYAQEYESLTKFVLIDSSAGMGSNYLNKLGRTTDFTSDFRGYAMNNYGSRLMDLVKCWITTQGLQNIIPGQVVQIFFPFDQQGDQMASYQYSGLWLVERVVHNMGDHFLTNLLLTRSGIDTDQGSTLLQATSVRQ